MRICPNDKFIEIFAQRFHYFKDPFYNFFASNLLFQNISYSLALKYLTFLIKYCSFAFYNINFRFKISKICQKLRIFLKFLTLEGTLVLTVFEILPNRNISVQSVLYLRATAHHQLAFNVKSLS